MTPEITVLEVLVHLNGVLSTPLADPIAPPAGWIAIPHGQASAAFGGDWLRAGEQLCLVLPSVVVPQARNLLLNPLHQALAQVALVHQETFQLDQRLA